MYAITALLALTSCPSLVAAGWTYSNLISDNGASPDQLPLFQQLNRTLDGRLAQGIPWAAPCYSRFADNVPSTNPEACAKVAANYTEPPAIAASFGAYQNSNWGNCQRAGRGCDLNFSSPRSGVPSSAVCYQGSVPRYYIPVASVSDVQAALSFTSKTKVPLVVKYSGHDYRGGSSGPNALALWTYPYKPQIMHQKDFVPEGCSRAVGDGVTVGAGHSFDELFQFAENNNITVLGGSVRSGGAAGGWLNGGGHGALSNTLGLGVDNALQIKTVLPNGTFVTANRCQHRDLFFAVRGGNGNSFGINMEVTYRAHPQLTLQVALIVFNATDLPAFDKAILTITQNTNKWMDDGWGGYIGFGAVTRKSVGLIMVTPKLSKSEAEASMKPMLDYAKSSASVNTTSAQIITVNSFYKAFKQYFQPNEERSGIGGAQAGRLIPRSFLSTQQGQKALADALSQVSNTLTYPTSDVQRDPLSPTYGAPLQLLMVTPSSYKPNDGESFKDSSITPAWRSAVMDVSFGRMFANNASASRIEEVWTTVHDLGNIFRELVPNSGAYQNEADIYEPNAPETFWGRENYEKLVAYKKEIDPENILTCWGCIGARRQDPRYGCYPRTSVS